MLIHNMRDGGDGVGEAGPSHPLTFHFFFLTCYKYQRHCTFEFVNAKNIALIGIHQCVLNAYGEQTLNVSRVMWWSESNVCYKAHFRQLDTDANSWADQLSTMDDDQEKLCTEPNVIFCVPGRTHGHSQKKKKNLVKTSCDHIIICSSLVKMPSHFDDMVGRGY